MKKITLSVILLGFTFNDYSAQQVTVHIENAGIFYVEKNVLSRALYQVLAQRVFVYGNRTIIL